MGLAKPCRRAPFTTNPLVTHSLSRAWYNSPSSSCSTSAWPAEPTDRAVAAPLGGFCPHLPFTFPVSSHTSGRPHNQARPAPPGDRKSPTRCGCPHAAVFDPSPPKSAASSPCTRSILAARINIRTKLRNEKYHLCYCSPISPSLSVNRSVSEPVINSCFAP